MEPRVLLMVIMWELYQKGYMLSIRVEKNLLIDCYGCDVAAQRIAHQLPPRRAASNHFKNATILRAEGGQLHARVGPQLAHVLFLSQSSGDMARLRVKPRPARSLFRQP